MSLLRHNQADAAQIFDTSGPEKTGKTSFEVGKSLHVPSSPVRWRTSSA